MFQITIIMYRIIQVTLIYRGRNENLVTQQMGLPYRCDYRLDTNVLHLKIMEHTIEKSLFEMFENLHLIINNKENKNFPLFPTLFP